MVRHEDSHHTGSRQIISSGIFRAGGGNAASSSARSSGASAMSSAPRFSRTCSTWPAFGIAMTPGCRSTHASATCAGVASKARGDGVECLAARRAVPARAASTPSPECRACCTTAAGRIRCRGASGCRAPDWWRRRAAARVERRELFHVVDVEVADAPVADLSVALAACRTPRAFRRAARGRASAAGTGRADRSSAVEGSPRRRRWCRAVVACCGSTLLTRKISPRRSPSASATSSSAAPSAVHFRGIDHRHAEVDGRLQRGNFVARGLRRIAHVPRADAERRDAFAAGERDGLCHAPL